MNHANTKILGVAALLTIGLTVGCAAGPQAGHQSDAAAKSIAEAKMAVKKATAVGYEWTTTATLMKEAEAAAAKGDQKTAVRLADEAKQEAELAVQQHAAEVKMNRGLRTS